MEQLNKVEILGTVGQVRLNQVGESRVANFSVATNYAFKNADGEPVIETTWHACTAWEQAGRLDDIRKGAAIHLFGRIRCRNYTSASGEQRTFTDIVVSKFDIKA